MNNYLDENIRYSIPADIIEDLHPDDENTVIFSAVFSKLKNENSDSGCIIKRTTITKITRTGDYPYFQGNGSHTIKSIKIEYADGNNFDFRHSWDLRYTYDYRFSDK